MNDNFVSNTTYQNITSSNVDNLLETISNDKTFYRVENLIGNTSLTVNKIYILVIIKLQYIHQHIIHIIKIL